MEGSGFVGRGKGDLILKEGGVGSSVLPPEGEGGRGRVEEKEQDHHLNSWSGGEEKRRRCLLFPGWTGGRKVTR